MFKPFRLAAIPALLLGLGGGLTGAAASPGVVELPALAVYENKPDAASGASVVGIAANAPGAAAFSELARQTAGWSVGDDGARGFGTITSLRGLGNTPFFSDASAPVYLDDIPLASGFTFPSELYDFSQVTIFRGPQAAALFGCAGDAGVIRLTSPAPGEQKTVHVGIAAGSFGQLAFTATAQTAHDQTADASLNVGSSRRNGYIANPQLGRPVDDRRAEFGRIKLRYRPGKDLELSLHVLGQSSHDGPQALVPLGGPYFTVNRGKEGVADTDFAAVAVGLTKQLDQATVSSTTSYSNWKLSPYANRLVVFGGLNLDSGLTQSQRTFNEELRYADGTFAGGAFFSQARTEGAVDRSIQGYPIERSGFDLQSETFALFARKTFSPSPVWSVATGLRWETTDKDFVRSAVVPAPARFQASQNWNALLPSLTVTRHLDAETDAVLTLARGYKAGGYSAYTGIASLAGFQPQRTWGIEAALATARPSARWSLTSRAYAYRVQGYQIERSFAVPGSAADEYLVVNAARAEVLGLEGEFEWRPFRSLMIGAVAALTRATLTSFTDPFTGATYNGNRAPGVPAGNAALHVAYRPATGLFGGAGVTWTGKTFFDERQTAGLAQPAYILVNADLGYAFDRGSIRLVARNLAGKNYYTSITPGLSHGTPGAPFTWGAELNRRW